MAYVVFVLVCLALYCPFFTLIALVTPWKGFAVFSVKHRHRQYRLFILHYWTGWEP